MKKRTERISNRLAEVRESRGLSAAGLAGRIGVSRQTIHAIEAGNYAPNTALALRLARLLETRVEELFRLAPDAPGAPRAIKVEVLPGGGAVAPGQPVRLCPVGKSMMAVPAPPVPAYFPTADGVLLKGGKTAALSAPGAPAGSVLIDRSLP